MIKRYFLLHSIKFLAAIIFISASPHTLADPTLSAGVDTGASDTKIPFFAIDSFGTDSVYINNQANTAFITDAAGTIQNSDYPFYLILPDDNPTSTSARVFSWDSATPGATGNSTKPTVTCPGATVDSSGTYSVTITLTAGAFCALTITSLTSNITYTATLSRAGNVYSVSVGTVCGGDFTCTPSTPTSASLFNFDKPAVVYGTEVTE